jgi:hypothetical protein
MLYRDTHIQYLRKQAKDPLDLVQRRKPDRLLDYQLRRQDDRHQQQDQVHLGSKYLNHLPLLPRGSHRVERKDKFGMGKRLLELLILSLRCKKWQVWSWRRLMGTKVREGDWMEYHLKCRKLGFARI